MKWLFEAKKRFGLTILNYSGYFKPHPPTCIESIAVGKMDFALSTKAKLGAKGIGRKVIENRSGFELKEFQDSYSPVFSPEKRLLSQNNVYFWDVFH